MLFKKKKKTRTEEQREYMCPPPPLWIRVVDILIRYIPYLYDLFKVYLIWFFALSCACYYVILMLKMLFFTLDLMIDLKVGDVIAGWLVWVRVHLGLSEDSYFYCFVIKPVVYVVVGTLFFLKCFGHAAEYYFVEDMKAVLRCIIIALFVIYDLYVYLLFEVIPLQWRLLEYDENMWIWLVWWLSDPYIAPMVQHFFELSSFPKQRYLFVSLTLPILILLYQHYTLRDYSSNFDYMFRWYRTIRNTLRYAWRFYKWPVGLYVLFHILWFVAGLFLTLFLITYHWIYKFWWLGVRIPSGVDSLSLYYDRFFPDWFRYYASCTDYILHAPYKWISVKIMEHHEWFQLFHPHWSKVDKETRYFAYSYIGSLILATVLLAKMFEFRDWVCLDTTRIEVVARKKLFCQVWCLALGYLIVSWLYFPVSEFAIQYLMVVCAVVLYTLSPVIYAIYLNRDSVFFPDFALYCLWHLFIRSLGWTIDLIVRIWRLIREYSIGVFMFLFQPVFDWYSYSFIPGIHKFSRANFISGILCAYIYVILVLIKIPFLIVFRWLPLGYYWFGVILVESFPFLWQLFLKRFLYRCWREIYLTLIVDREKEIERERSGKATKVDWYAQDFKDERAYKELQERIHRRLIPQEQVSITKHKKVEAFKKSKKE